MNGAVNNLPNVAIVGRPNVGKSALFNRLIGRRIAIVHDQPGITRDRISAVCTRGTQPFVVWDTGGIAGAGESELAVQVRHAVQEAIHNSDVLLFLVDAKDGLSPIDQELARLLRKSHKPVVLVINKIDNERQENLAADFASLGFQQTNSISAEHNRGIFELLETTGQLLPSPTAARDIKPQTSNLKPPVAIAIIGRPNVGKSSLINSILRSDRAIVSELPGTTRDSVDISYERDGQKFLFIDTAGIRRRGRHSSSVEVFSVMRAERSIRRADVCVLIVDLTMGVTAQDKRIAGLIQKAAKAAIVVLNKWDLIRPKRREKQAIAQLVDETRARIFFLDYAPVLVASALTGENIDKLFALVERVRRAAQQRIGTGVLNRLLRTAFAANPPPMISGRRLKLFYAAQASDKRDRQLQPPEFVLFVNEPRLLPETYRRYLEARIRKAQPYPGLPIILTLRPRSKNLARASRVRTK
ncbi:MAG TPA: ribosome biogenesis GTPase Der [Candidatus Udaeobacter sp.]|jgi:GTP-binding protein|nr:ribosome biogenesis GTPase Der [Candidatus Udaeobacter sp.]